MDKKIIGVFHERLYPVNLDDQDNLSGWGQFFGEVEMIHDEVSEFQHIQIFNSQSWQKRFLVLDGIVQLTEEGNHPYHEMMVHVAVQLHSNVKRVLVIGAGDGGIIKDLFRYQNIEKVTMVEIDERVIELSKEYLPGVSAGAFADERLDLRIMDGRQFVEECQEKFDLIIVDSTDPIGPGAELFTEEFYQECHRLLGEEGILITQNGVPRLQGEELTDSITFMHRLFNHATCYLGDMPDYVGGNMAFGFASNHDYLSGDWPKDESAVPEGLDYFNFDVLQAAFALPNYVKKLLP